MVGKTYRKNSILLAGDSVAKGIVFDAQRKRYVRAKKGGFAEEINQQMGLEVEQISHMGWKVGDVKRAIENRLDENNKEPLPELLVIEIGGNDCDFNWEEIAMAPEKLHMPKTSLDDYTNELSSIIEFARARGVRPVLMNLPPIDADRYMKFFTGGDKKKIANVLKWLGQVGKIYWWHERYNAAMEYVAELTGTRMINIRQAFLRNENYREFICEDGIHPNERGQELMIKTAKQYFNRYLKNK